MSMEEKKIRFTRIGDSFESKNMYTKNKVMLSSKTSPKTYSMTDSGNKTV